MTVLEKAVWVFGYGSLIWRPGFDYVERAVARLDGVERRFWQGSHDHRGIPESPGRVVTLVDVPSAVCTGMAYLVDATVARQTFEALDHREKNGYDKRDVSLSLNDGRLVPGVVYVGEPGNFAWLGEAPLGDIAAQIAASVGPSGSNAEYLFELAKALRSIDVDDPHVFALESAVRNQVAGKHAKDR